MKLITIIKKTGAAFLPLLIAATVLVACDGMNDMHNKYLENGEIVYLPKPDSVVFLPDRYSALIRLWIYNSPNTKSIDLYWNNGRDSLIFPVSLHTGMDSVDIKIPDLEEQAYEFSIFTSNHSGNRSIPVQGSVTVIGDLWENSISDRRVSKIEYTSEYTMIWWDASNGGTYTELEYDGLDGTTRMRRILPGETETWLSDAVQGFAHLRYRSVYVIAGNTIFRDWFRYAPRYLVYPVGDATPYGWVDYDAIGIPAPADNPNVYDFEMNLGQGNVRFMTEPSFSSIQLWPHFWSTGLPGEGSFQLTSPEVITANWVTSAAGLYHIHLDLDEMTYKIALK
jgi:hypothetical protein